jgi:N-glycosylase/DNA lyase
MAEETLYCNPSQLNLDHTLSCGQAFRWRKEKDGCWAGVVRGVSVTLYQRSEEIAFQTLPPASDAALLEGYFRLALNLEVISRDLASRDEAVAEAISRFAGLRVLRQEPEECLISFVCSTANSIPQIARSIEQMCTRFGRPIGAAERVRYHAFPTIEALADAPIEDLAIGCELDWRGANVKLVASQLLSRPSQWLAGLRDSNYGAAWRALQELKGVGPKIADAVCLFSLEKDEAVPIDLHIWRVTQQLYRPDLAGKTLTPRLYSAVGDFWRQRFGPYAGWAQQYLYYADVLRSRRGAREIGLGSSDRQQGRQK